jgi:4-amino-4-deoxy-L-arabinose transferase-like glycosyltransferase
VTRDANCAIGRSDARALRLHDMLRLAGLAFLLRCMLVAWAAPRFLPAEDGKYYQIVAWRMARGLGYTWLWPDGAVTYAAHYPVGYPALIGGLYALFGPRPWLAMLLNALLGSLAVAGVYRLAATVASRRGAVIAAAIAVLHPTLFFYTPALMTEIVSASLLAIAAWLAVEAAERESGCRTILMIGIGLIMGVSVLVRPQQIVLAPFLGWVAMGARGATLRLTWRKGLIGAFAITSIAVASCLPWTYRNCERMGRCMLVSANAGWNLLIGTAPEGNGAWIAVDKAGIPAACRTVFDEAKKDVCFGNGAVERIRQAPGAWLSLMPKKLQRTFDDVGTPGWYLHSSNWQLFPENHKTALGAAEVLAQRIVLLMALFAILRIIDRGVRNRWYFGFMTLILVFPHAWAAILLACMMAFFLGLGRTSVLVAMVCALLPVAWVSVLLLVVAALTLGVRLLDELPLFLAMAGLSCTAIIHAIFFGGARYAIVTMPWTIALAGCAFRPKSDATLPGSLADSAPTASVLTVQGQSLDNSS